METSKDSSQRTGEQPRAERKGTRGSRHRGVDSVTKKFLRNFDPERSEREKRKLNRRLYLGGKRHHAYDEKGIFTQTGENLCDCLQKDCPGCHFTCPKCSSTKCGHECRNNRKWAYESIENEGSDIVTRNPALKEA
ncbi:ARL14 effector protein [Orussus abietinus]|uniref:ARL14 effector protein n=1 Tax=Orussus abietinus TaxID=222816 RepID=UPI000626D17D|nr:ARL14 effector protein [Orussus abietinus]XP_012270947.1 ARL14 effector protein [Orussus abietinus]XP_012270948.1 ARL14 effector protein [Orussus abietinus]